MRLEDFNTIADNRKDGIKRNIVLTDLSVSMIDSISTNRSDTIRTGISCLYHNQFIVIRIENTLNKRILLVTDRAIQYYSANHLHRYLLNDNRIGVDLKEYGPGVFTVNVLGLFPTVLDAISFKDYMLNSLLNGGAYMYNEETYTGLTPRVFHLSINDITLNEFAAACKARSYTINTAINKFVKSFIKKT